MRAISPAHAAVRFARYGHDDAATVHLCYELGVLQVMRRPGSYPAVAGPGAPRPKRKHPTVPFRQPAQGPRRACKTVARTGQESRSMRRSAAPTMTSMDLRIRRTPLHSDPRASPIYRDVVGFEVCKDVGSGEMRWIAVGPPGQPGMSILLARPAATPVSPTTSAAPSPR